MTRRITLGLFIMSSLWLLLHAETLTLQGTRTKWVLKDKLLGMSETDRVFLGEEFTGSKPKKLTGPGGPVAIKVTTKVNYDNEVRLSRKKNRWDYNGAKFYFLVFEIVGRSLDTIHKMLGRPMSPRTVAAIGEIYIKMLQNMHLSMNTYHQNFVARNMAIGFNDPRKFYVIGSVRSSHIYETEIEGEISDNLNLLRTLLILSLPPNATLPQILVTNWQNVSVDSVKIALRDNKIFQDLPEELKDLAIACVEWRERGSFQYENFLSYLIKLLNNPKYGEVVDYDWKDLPNLVTSLESLETVHMNSIGEPPKCNCLLTYIFRFIKKIISAKLSE